MGLKKKVCIVWIILSYAVTYSYSQNIFSCGKYCSCESNKDGNTIANCSLRNLKAIPLDLPNNITDLNLSWNQINLQSALHPPLCTIYGSLSTLTLAWNNIEKMSQVLTGCDKLVQLDLTGNKLQSLNAKTFPGLGKLITLQGLEVVNIEAETFKRFPNLQSLNFTYYGTFPNLRLFKDLHYLRELEIYFEKIARPDATLFHFERNNSLKILKLNSPLVKFFPNTLLSGLKSLEYLSFSAPSLSLFTLAKEGKPLQLKRLEIFNVRKVDPELLSGMSQLEVLKLHSVKNTDKLKLVPSIRDLEVFETTMNSIPDNWLFNLTFLVRLNLSEIPLDKIEHKDIIHLKSLKFLEISGNAMTVLPSNFLEPLKLSLEKFKMHHCDLSKLDDNAISSMMVLQEIDLSNNYIEWIGEGNFVNMPYLRKLNLQNNIIHSMQINKGWFTTASELRKINLSNNNLNNFPEALLDTNLTELALAGNNISVLPAQKLCGLESLSVLILADNPIHCDLSTEKLLNCLPGLQVDGKCETPSNVRNCKISELEICLHKLSSTSVTSEPTSTETKNSSKKRVMNMIQQDTESGVIVRPIVTLRYDEAVANSKSEVIQPSISTADNVEIAKLFGNEANRNTVISDQLLQKKQKENMKNDSDTSNNTVHNAMNKSNVATSNISDEDTETFSLQAQRVNNSQIEPLSQLQSNLNNSLNDSTTVSNSFQSKYINMNNSVTDSASSSITSQSNYISVNNFTTERFTVGNTSQSTNMSISNFTTNSATGDVNILIKFEQSSNQQIYIQGKNDSFLNINDSLIPIKTQEYNDTLNNTKVNLVAEMDQVSKPFEDLSTNTAGNKTILNSTFSLLTGIANVSMDIAQKENMKNDSDTTSNNTVHNAMNKSNVATSNISDEDTETFSLQAQKVNNSQIEPLSQLQSNMNNSLNDSTTVSNSFQSKYINMNNSVTDSASSSITSQSNYISVNNFTTERFTVGNTSQSTNMSISNFTTNSATGDVNILIKFEQSSNQQIYIQGKNDSFLNINDSLIPIKTQEYNDTLNNTKVNLVSEMDQVSKPFEDLSTNTAGNKTILNSTFSLLTGIANVSMDIAQKENMKNDSDTTSNNTVHNAMNKSNVATSNISDEDTETFSLQAQKVNNSQIEPLSQLQSNMNNSLNDSTTVSNSFQSKYINMNNSVTDSASSSITSQSNYISVNNFTTERFTVGNTSQSTNMSISNFTTNSATGDVNILIKFEQSSNQQIYIQGKNDSFLNINDSLIPIKTQEYNDTLNNTKVNLVSEMDQVSKPFEDLSTNTAGNKTILNSTFSLLTGIANVSMDIAQKENMKNDSDTTSNNTVHNAMNKSNVATSNISDEDTETFSLQAQKVNNSQIEPLSQLQSNMNNSLNDSTTVSNSFQSKYINMNNSVTDSASSSITSQSNYISVNNFTTERFTVGNTSQSTNMSISNFTTNSATGDVNILIKFEQSSNQQIYIQGKNDSFLNINDSLIPIKTQEYNDTLNNTKVNLVSEMDQVSKPFEDLSTNTAGNKTILNNTFSLLAGTANVSMDIAQGDNINKPSVGSQSKVSKENDQPKWNASNITFDITSSKPFTANKNMSIYGIKSVDNTLFQVNTSEAENPGKELKQSFKSDLQNTSIINESTATPFKNVHTFQSYTKTTNNNVPMADWLTLSSSVKENLVLKNDSEMEGGINQVIQHTQGSYLSRSKGVEKTSPNSDSKPTLHSQDIKSQSLSNIEALSNNSYGPSSTPSESIFGPDSQIKIPAKEPVPVHIKEVEHTESPLGSLIATLIVVTLLILIMGGGFLWFKKCWQTGSYNAATRGSGQVDQVNISLASINQTS